MFSSANFITAEYGSCTHTLREDNPWIRVDIDSQYSGLPIEAVVVYNRDDCCGKIYE